MDRKTVGIHVVVVEVDVSLRGVQAHLNIRVGGLELRQARDMEALKEDFFSMVSHDLRTPLTSIKSWAEILLDDWERIEPAERERYLGIVNREEMIAALSGRDRAYGGNRAHVGIRPRRGTACFRDATTDEAP